MFKPSFLSHSPRMGDDILPDAQSIASAVDVAGSGMISQGELTAYFAGVNAKYGRDSDVKSASILSVLNSSTTSSSGGSSLSVPSGSSQYTCPTHSKYPDKLTRLLPIALRVRETDSWLWLQHRNVNASQPPWLRGEMEAPAGTKDMGAGQGVCSQQSSRHVWVWTRMAKRSGKLQPHQHLLQRHLLQQHLLQLTQEYCRRLGCVNTSLA